MCFVCCIAVRSVKVCAVCCIAVMVSQGVCFSAVRSVKVCALCVVVQSDQQKCAELYCSHTVKVWVVLQSCNQSVRCVAVMQ